MYVVTVSLLYVYLLCMYLYIAFMFDDDVYDDPHYLNRTNSLYISSTSVLQFHLTSV